MEDYIVLLHKILTVFLAVLYLALIFRFYKSRREVKWPDHVLAQLARLVLLLLYVSGFWMSVRMGIIVHKLHHVFSVLPIIIIFTFQNIAAQRRHDLKAYAWMFSTLFVTLCIITFFAFLSVVPKF